MAWSGEVHPGDVVLPRVVGMMGPKKREGIGQNVLGHRRQTDTALHTIYWGCCAGCVYISLEAHRGARIGTSLLAAAAPWLLCVFLFFCVFCRVFCLFGSLQYIGIFLNEYSSFVTYSLRANHL